MKKNTKIALGVVFVVALVLLNVVAIAGCETKSAPAKATTVMSPGAGAGPKVNVETLAQKTDPVCHMPLDAEVSFTEMRDGKTYGFCSAFCKSEFEKDPVKYLKNPKQ